MITPDMDIQEPRGSIVGAENMQKEYDDRMISALAKGALQELIPGQTKSQPATRYYALSRGMSHNSGEWVTEHQARAEFPQEPEVKEELNIPKITGHLALVHSAEAAPIHSELDTPVALPTVAAVQ